VAGAKSLWLFLLPFPLLVKAVLGLWTGELATLLANGSAYGMFIAAAVIARRGLINEIERAERPFSKAAAFPQKTLAGILVGIGTAIAAFAAVGYDLVISVLFGIGAIIGFFCLYGFDARARTIVSSEPGVSAEELRQALAEGYGRLDGIKTASQGIASREFRDRLRSIVALAEKVLKAVEEDPRDLRRARKFLNVYLDGVVKVTDQYARTHTRSTSPELEQNFRNLLIDMENVCKEQHEKLLQNDMLDLDVQIEVLTSRLKREGVL
jgi:5-bromo-4-chloroindolyl phosphate hydrolysis protein